MNPGSIALLTVLGTLGALGAMVWYRDLIFKPTAPSAPATTARRKVRRPANSGRRNAAEMRPKPAEMVSSVVSGADMQNINSETVSLETISLLVAAGLVNETAAIETVFNVHAGSGKKYKRLQAEYKKITAAKVVQNSSEGGQ